jgi:hypothetical protein
VGALTAKPTAFHFRTWDVKSVQYTSCQDSFVPLIRVDIYQKKIVRVLPLEDWISDNIRFLFLNLDKQTLKFPGLIFKLKSIKVFNKVKKVLRQHTYTSVINYLVKRISKKRQSKLSLNILLGSIFSKNLNLYQRLNTKNVNVNLIAKNSYLQYEKNIDISLYSEITLLNVNPRLDSPLCNLKLKDLDSDYHSIKSIGNYNNDYEIYSNNPKSLLNQNDTSLLIFSENYKDNKFIVETANAKLNLSPVYLNLPVVFNKIPHELKNDKILFNFGVNDNLNRKDNFVVNFNTAISKLDFDIYMPVSNYFVTSGELISTKGIFNLKMIRPSFSLKDYILGLSVIIRKGKFSNIKDSSKIYNFFSKSKYNIVLNRLSYFHRKLLLLQK